MPERSSDLNIAAGDLDRRITLQSPVYNTDGDEIASWQSEGDVWAAVQPASGLELEPGQQIIAEAQISVMIRFRADVDARWRVIDGPHTYEIKAVLDLERRQETLKLMCMEVV
jgi:SPP1 family predicted phage head-tail adaptor